MRADTLVRHDIAFELQWAPELQGTDILVEVDDGVVTLAGSVGRLWQRWLAEDIVGRVNGVRAIANQVEVRLPATAARPDPDLAREILRALRWHAAIPADRIQVKVADGWVRLKGRVESHYQSKAAERAVGVLAGVRGILNLLQIDLVPQVATLKQDIERAIIRGASQDAQAIMVEVDGHRVTLRGSVRSYRQTLEAERAARNTKGVTDVRNLLMVGTTPVVARQ